MKALASIIIIFSLLSFTVDDRRLVEINNFHQVDSLVFRSGQPSSSEMRNLERAGFKTILNLRNIQDDDFESRDTKLIIKHLPIRTKAMNQDDIIEALRIIRDSEKPILVHCLHGSDRTGVVVAAYRMVFQGWSKLKAVEEFSKPGFGYHDMLFPHLLKLVENIDSESIKTKLNI